MCRNPYTTSGGKAFGCGQCLPCLINKRRVWTHRIILESQNFKDNAFATLTYRDDCLPRTDTGLATLDRRDLKLFFMRLNTRLKRMEGPFPDTFRYFACGEYGDETERPHYHAALFGFPTCAAGNSELYCVRRDGTLNRRSCLSCKLVSETWERGKIHLGSLEGDSAAYVAAYVTKKMTKADDVRLLGRYPEYAVMSRRPGIGYHALWELADWFLKSHSDQVDVYSMLRHGKNKKMPLGRYLKQKLRVMVGRDEKTPEAVLSALVAEVSEVYAAVKEICSAHPQALRYVFRDMLAAADDARVARQNFYRKLKPRRKTL